MDSGTMAGIGTALLGDGLLLMVFLGGMYLILNAAIKRLEKKLDEHEDHCDERWSKNWDQHDSFREDIAEIKGRLGGHDERNQ